MNIQQISIENFRNIGHEKSYELNPKFNVIIGINGRGKSTILHAVRVICGAYFLGIPEVKKRHIYENEIRLKDLNDRLIQQKPVRVSALGYFPELNTSIRWQRQIPEYSNSTTSSEAEVGRIRRIGKEKYEAITKKELNNIDLPIIAFFGTSRVHGAGRNRKSRLGRQIFKEGYHDWIEMKASTFKYQDWLFSYYSLKNNGREYPNTLKAFFETLHKANPYIQQAENNFGELKIKVKIGECQSDNLPIELHSDGIRCFTEMVAELAYRCIILNGHLDDKAIEESRGVVMIDEIDLHLHPEWQRHVVADLKKAFPNIQFVVTTHSPFIVQSLTTDELINLDDIPGLDEDPNKYSIEEVSAQEMGVKNVERSKTFLEMQEEAKKYFSLILSNSDAESIQNAKMRLDHLRIRYNNDPAYVALLESEMPVTK